MTGTDADRVAWALLSRAAAGPCPPLTELIHRLGASDAAAALCSGKAPFPMPAAVLARTLSFDAAARDLDRVHQLGGRLVTPHDSEWPHERLSCLPTGSDNSGDAAPLALWVGGAGTLPAASARAITITGARASTEYGNGVARSMAGGLAESGWTVVAGAAFGIDAAAHRAALDTRDGLTVAVLPCGLDRAYPYQHEQLLAHIADRGLIVSEYPPGTAVYRRNFLDRNRITAALSAAVVAVEAGLRSGSGSTVRWARRMGHPAFAVPGPATSAASWGCHQFIADGSAQLVSSAEDVLQAMSRHPTQPKMFTAAGERLGVDGVIR
ncbi:DNA-processing protein DprA [Nocardia sp. NPDC004722]